ncbi:MAG: hypothetical protein ACC654_01655 [Acidimicrobiia bacterium]
MNRVVVDSELAIASPPGRRRPVLLATVAAGAVLGFGFLFSLLGSEQGPYGEDPVPEEPAVDVLAPPETLPVATTLTESTTWGIPIVEPTESIDGIPYSGNPGTLPITGWIPGDDGTGPLTLGEVNGLPGNLYLDFLVEFCDGSFCFRDAVMRNIDDSGPAPDPASDPSPFVVRHGFPSSTDEPLGEGFGVDVYITRRDGPQLEDGVFELDQTYKYTSDYVVHGTANECGPTYKEQSGPVECEWFVHDFPDGIPAGRYDLWAVWRAPCSAWLDMSLTDSCSDPSEVVSMFSASANSPFGYDN